MKKFISTIAIITVLCSLTACNGNSTNIGNSTSSGSSTSSGNYTENNEPNSKPSEISLKDIEAAIANALGDGYLCTANVPKDELPISCIGELDMDKIDEYIVKRPNFYAQDTVGIIKCKSGYADEAVQKFNEYFSRNIGYILQYPFDVAKVEGTRIYKVGDIVIYITLGAAYEGDNREEEAKLAAAEYEKIDNAMKKIFGNVPENLAVMPKEDETGFIPIMPRDDKNNSFNINDLDKNKKFANRNVNGIRHNKGTPPKSKDLR